MIRVTISDNRLIPSLGRGPFNNPILISDQLYRQLKLAGYKIKKYVSNPENYIENKFKNEIKEVKNTVEKELIKEEVKEDITEPESSILPTNVEETVNEEENIEDNSIESDEEETVGYTEEELNSMSAKELRKILDENSIEYKNNESKVNLIKIILENQ